MHLKNGKANIIQELLITFSHLEAFHKFSCYQCGNPLPPQATSAIGLEWDTIGSESDSRYEMPMVRCPRPNSQAESENRDKINSFGTRADVGRQGGENSGKSVEYLLVTKKRLEDKFQDLSSDTNVESEERNFRLPPTLGETQMKYLQGLASMRQYPLWDLGNPISPTSTLRSEVDSLLGEDYIQSSLQSSDEHSVGSTKERIVKTSVGEGPISAVKKYLENNICELREQRLT